MAEYVERLEYNNTISVKLVIPGSCNAHCSFCYMKDRRESIDRITDDFSDNYINSLLRILQMIDGKNPVSLDITGNEPTLHANSFIKNISKIKEYKQYLSRVTLTTNGYNIVRIAPVLRGIVDYVNISVHDFDLQRRRSIFGITDVLDDNDYRNAVSILKKNGIPCSAVSVIHKPVIDFAEWRDNFIKWCKEIGFISLRFRCDVFWDCQGVFDDYMSQTMDDNRFTIITHENTPDSHWCRLRMRDKFRVFFLHGVPDTSEVTKGIEYVIGDDGHLYCDYYKTPIEQYNYVVGKIFDRK